MGDLIAVMEEGGRLAQFGPPDEILAHPASDFVARFVGEDRGLKRLSLVTSPTWTLEPIGRHAPVCPTFAPGDEAARRAVGPARGGHARRRRPRRGRPSRAASSRSTPSRAPSPTTG